MSQWLIDCCSEPTSDCNTDTCHSVNSSIHCDEGDIEADDVNAKAHMQGMTAEEVTDYYNSWASQGTYELVCMMIDSEYIVIS